VIHSYQTYFKINLSLPIFSLGLTFALLWKPPHLYGDEAAVKAAVHNDVIMLTVDKGALTASLKTWSETPEEPNGAIELRHFRIAIGKAEGDKQQEGDNRTPEGVYFAQSHINGNSLPQKYGSLAIPIDFPNPMDRISGKTGHGIWLHGVDRDQRIEEAKVTEGCVAFYNTDIARLSTWLKSFQGVVVIASDTSKVNKPEDLKEVRALTTKWMEAWQQRDIDKYTGFYSSDFRFDKYDLVGYKKYKKNVFNAYKTMSVDFDNLRVVSHPKYAVSFFNQDFNGDDRFRSVGRKVLYWEKQANGGWSIRREVFENRRFELVTFTDAELALLSDTASGISSGKDETAPN
jgi:murein L,D-transpeptidase YafK